MRVAVVDFGSVWRHRAGKCDAGGRLSGAVYYNTTGIVVRGEVRQRPQICGYARFDTVGGFDPHHPSRMVGCVFECAEPSVWLGYNKLLFRRILKQGEYPERLLVVARSELIGHLPIGNEDDWRSPDTWLLSFSEYAGKQEAMLLMSVGDWVRTGLGKFVLEPAAINGWHPWLMLRAGE